MGHSFKGKGPKLVMLTDAEVIMLNQIGSGAFPTAYDAMPYHSVSI